MPNELVEIEIEKAYGAVLADPIKVLETVRENVGPRGITQYELDRIKIPAGGGKAWELPSLDGDATAKEFHGIVIFFQDARRYWAQAIGEGEGVNVPPDCYSDDGEIGHGNPGGACERCPFAAFGSKEGSRGQACKAIRLIYVLRPGDTIPAVVPLPPTSLRGARQTFLRLASKGIPYYGVLMRFELAQQKNAGGKVYSVAVLKIEKTLTPEQIDKVRRMRDAYLPLVKGAQPVVDDFGGDADDGEGGLGDRA